MKKILLGLFVPLFAFFAFAASQSEANTVLVMPMTAPASPYSSSAPQVTNAPIYSSNEYPSAQGQYLQVPPSYATQSTPQPTVLPQPVNNVGPTYQEIPSPSYGVSGAATATSAPAVITAPAATAPMTAVSPAAAASSPTVSGTASSPQPLPSYTYDENLDPSRVPYKTPKAHDPKPNEIGVNTTTGAEIGFQGSAYRYQEHVDPNSVFAKESGPQFAITASATKAWTSQWFATIDLRGGYGINDYSSSQGSVSGDDDFTFETRILGGHDFIFRDALWHSTDIGFSPYAGLGFRWLYNDAKGFGIYQGYDRYSHYLYLPVGATTRFRLTDRARLALNLEYDQLLYGWQESDLSDGDITDTQKGGYGMRGSLEVEWNSFGIGPYAQYWNINQSTTDGTGVDEGFEPHNQTLEYGLQLKYRF